MERRPELNGGKQAPAFAGDGVRRIMKKTLCVFFPSNRPTKKLCFEEAHEVRWTSVLRGPKWNVDRNSMGASRHQPANKKRRMLMHPPFLVHMPVMGLEPIRCCHQQILSLPRLPIPTHRLIEIQLERKLLYYGTSLLSRSNITPQTVFDKQSLNLLSDNGKSSVSNMICTGR